MLDITKKKNWIMFYRCFYRCFTDSPMYDCSYIDIVHIPNPYSISLSSSFPPETCLCCIYYISPKPSPRLEINTFYRIKNVWKYVFNFSQNCYGPGNSALSSRISNSALSSLFSITEIRLLSLWFAHGFVLSNYITYIHNSR